jgi:hypothetical protein
MSQRRHRPPMFVFVFDGALFKFKFHRPAFVVLFQLPPRIAPRKARSIVVVTRIPL